MYLIIYLNTYILFLADFADYADFRCGGLRSLVRGLCIPDQHKIRCNLYFPSLVLRGTQGKDTFIPPTAFSAVYGSILSSA